MQIYVDMDGVLADFDAHKVKYFKDSGLDIFKKPYNPKHDEIFWSVIRKEHPRWFLQLPSMPDMGELWFELDNHSPIILSAIPGPKKEKVRETLFQKQHWLKDRSIYWPAIFCLRSHKQDYATPNSILIDDDEKNIAEWRKKGGIGILHTSAVESIKELKKTLAMSGQK